MTFLKLTITEWVGITVLATFGWKFSTAAYGKVKAGAKRAKESAKSFVQAEVAGIHKAIAECRESDAQICKRLEALEADMKEIPRNGEFKKASETLAESAQTLRAAAAKILEQDSDPEDPPPSFGKVVLKP